MIFVNGKACPVRSPTNFCEPRLRDTIRTGFSTQLEDFPFPFWCSPLAHPSPLLAP
jgi:hypothetical protein